MCSETKPRHSRHIHHGEPEYGSRSSALSLKESWFDAEALHALQELFDALWLLVQNQVFPWDVEASREMLAIQLFKSIPGGRGDSEQIKQAVLALWQIRQQQEPKRSSSYRHKVIVLNTRPVTPIYDPQHLPAP
jgi:hypothetical protein